MGDIKVVPKPDWVTWDDIHTVLAAAHTVNHKHSFHMINANLTGEKIQRKVGNGICVVALDGDKVVGTQSVAIFTGDRWYSKGQTVAHYCLTGILKRYQGCGIKEMLDEGCYQFVRKMGPDILQANTAESNVVIRDNARKMGWVDLQCYTFKGTDYYSVFFAIWYKKRPFPLWYCHFRYWLSVIYTKTRYKPGRIERFRAIAIIARLVNKLKRIIM